jgi:hypothetical protein
MRIPGGMADIPLCTQAFRPGHELGDAVALPFARTRAGGHCSKGDLHDDESRNHLFCCFTEAIEINTGAA